MGTHPKGREHFDWARHDCDIWMFNETPNLKDEKGELKYPRADAVIQLHTEAIWKNPINRSDKDHHKWLTSGKTPTVYMQKKYDEVPKSVEYPLEKVLALVKNVQMVINGKQKDFRYFSSSPDFAMALVAEMWKRGQKYKRVEVWGIELELESEYQYQRTGFAFWTGYLAALGIKVIHHNSVFDAPMYGYEGDVSVPSTEFEKRIIDLTKELGEDKDRYNQDAKVFLASLSELLKKDVSISVIKELNELIKHGEQAGIINGKIRESQRYLEKARAMEEVSGESVFSLGEFDGARITFNKQSFQVQVEISDLNKRLDPLLKKLLNLKKNTHKRQRAIDEFGNLVAELLNKSILLFHVIGAVKENQYYVDSLKLSIRNAGGSI